MIILPADKATDQVESLAARYSGLQITEANSSQIRLRGSIRVYRTAYDFTVNKEYNIELLIPVDSDLLPCVYEIGNQIDKEYPHRYSDGKLCLETDTAIKLRFFDGLDLIEWMDEFVEPYFFSYEYYCRFGTFPFGERPHDLKGMIDTYKEQFHEEDDQAVFIFLKHIATGQYRGHHLCPCGSGKRLRYCHGYVLYPFMTDQRKREIASSDFFTIMEEIKRYENARQNNTATKL